MSQLHFSMPGFAKPDFLKQTKRSADQKGLQDHLPSADASDKASAPGKAANTSAKAPTDVKCKTIELRIVQDGKIYRSKAEEERLVMLGQWHHRRRRRRMRMRG